MPYPFLPDRPVDEAESLRSLAQGGLPHARSLALGRMQQEATLLRAHAVVDVRFERREFEWGTDLLEFQVMGTAVRLANAPVPERAVTTVSPSTDAGHELHAEARTVLSVRDD
jgi:Putative heavy-metal-binding